MTVLLWIVFAYLSIGTIGSIVSPWPNDVSGRVGGTVAVLLNVCTLVVIGFAAVLL